MRWIEQRMRRKDERVNRALAQLRKGAADMDRLALAPMNTAPAVTPDSLALIKATIAKDATDAELQLFLHDCARQNVHPLDRLIHFTKRSNKYTPVTSIDFLRTRAHDSGECAGIDEPVFTGAPKTAAFAATVTVWRLVQGSRYAFTATARWAEYKPDQAFMWDRMPHTMLGKCAEALALRKAFPKQLTGLYVKEEMEQAEPKAPVTRPVTPPRLSKSLTPSPGPAAEGTAAAVSHPEPAVGAAAAPADLNESIPDAWKPFIKTESQTGVIIAGKRSKSTGKTTITLRAELGVEIEGWTTDHDVARAVTAYKDAQTPVTVTLLESGEIVTLSEAVDAAF
jgi:phage recombination protein Bet